MGGVIFYVLRDAKKYPFISNDVVVIPRLPRKIGMDLLGRYLYTDFKTTNYRSQIFGLGAK